MSSLSRVGRSSARSIAYLLIALGVVAGWLLPSWTHDHESLGAVEGQAWVPQEYVLHVAEIRNSDQTNLFIRGYLTRNVRRCPDGTGAGQAVALSWWYMPIEVVDVHC